MEGRFVKGKAQGSDQSEASVPPKIDGMQRNGTCTEAGGNVPYKIPRKKKKVDASCRHWQKLGPSLPHSSRFNHQGGEVPRQGLKPDKDGERTRADGKKRVFGKRELALNGEARTFLAETTLPGSSLGIRLIPHVAPGKAQSNRVFLNFAVNAVKKQVRGSW